MRRASEFGGPVRALRRVLARRDALLVVLLFLLTVALRRPHKMRFPYGWDSLLYLRALDHFNATIHQPQPPGYLFYVSTARLLDLLLADPHRALVWVSILASGVAVAALYLLTRLLYDPVTGVVAAGLLLTSVAFWFYGEVAYPYTTLAAGSIVLALLALALRRGLLPGGRGAALTALAFGLLGGFRQDLLLFLAPLFVAGLWRRPSPHWMLAIGAGALGTLAWLLPTAALSEGLVKYLSATLQQGSAASVGSSAFATGLANARDVATFLWRGLYFALAPLAYYLVCRLAAPRTTDPGLPWVLLWLAPPLAFYVLAHVGDLGYTLSVLPAVLVLAARGVVLGARDLLALGAARHTRLRAGAPRRPAPGVAATLSLLLGAVLVAAHAGLFLGRAVHLSAAGIDCFDQTMEARLRLVHAHFRPHDTLVFAAGNYQHVRYYLPEYRSWLYEPLDGPQVERTIEPGTRFLLIFEEVVHPSAQPALFGHFTLPCNGTPFYYTVVRHGDIVHFDAEATTITVQRQLR